MENYMEDLTNTVAKAENIRDSFNPRFEQIKKDLLERKANANAMDQTMSGTVNKVSKIEECLKSIVEKSLNILKVSAGNTKTLISKLDEEKDILEIDPDTEGTGDVQGPITRTRGKKKEKKPNKDLDELKAIVATYDQLVIKVEDLLKTL